MVDRLPWIPTIVNSGRPPPAGERAGSEIQTAHIVLKRIIKQYPGDSRTAAENRSRLVTTARARPWPARLIADASKVRTLRSGKYRH